MKEITLFKEIQLFGKEVKLYYNWKLLNWDYSPFRDSMECDIQLIPMNRHISRDNKSTSGKDKMCR